MASSVVRESGHSQVPHSQSPVMPFEALVYFTREPPPGEDFFTVVMNKDVVKLPLGIVPDAELTREARKKVHVIEFKNGKKTPIIASSCVFSRVHSCK